jgi:octaheme c-type cytochrome (tetrathionate reductase family)
MRGFRYIWLAGLGATLIVIAVPILLFASPSTAITINPWDSLPVYPQHTDHSALITVSELTTGPDVTRTCLSCHEDAGEQMLHSVHFQWKGEPVILPGRDEPVAIGKLNVLNNFCLGIRSNEVSCTRCHAGYGWDSADYDFTAVENVDCLVCHDQSGQYVKGNAGLPVEEVDLLAAARSVGLPTRTNCGSCHFNGGGGAGVKHGELDPSLYFPSGNVDVHMGEHDFQCITCHRSEDHFIAGRSSGVSVDSANRIACTDCHDSQPHTDTRINSHTDTLACQTCHVPAGALRQPTKVIWDWSTAGQDIEEDEHAYLKIKGSFVYETEVIPDYVWFNGEFDRYLFGDVINPAQITPINRPLGDINDPNAQIWPFKIHDALQPYDTVNNILLQPTTSGEGGYWTTFDWVSALEMGAAATGVNFSGQYGFTETIMHWQQTHMVQPAEQALQCAACHGEGMRMDWRALGYPGDPMIWGGR